MRLIVATILLAVSLFASLGDEKAYVVDRYIADSLDIPPSFLNTPRFRQIYKRYSRNKHKSFLDVKKPESYFIPELERILEREGVPEIFLFMAMAESNFATHARSSKSAVGIWQFMPQTARKYGLRVDRYVDERKDPIKSTKAAVKYLKYLYGMFGKWYLAALAYNAGEGTLLKAIKRAGTKNLRVLLDERKKYLPKESREYLYKIVALAKLSYDIDSKMSQELGYILARGADHRIVPVQVKGLKTIEDIAESIRLKPAYLKALNPHLLKGHTPPDAGRYTVYIPKFKQSAFRKNVKPGRSYRGFMTYKVKKGDSLYTLSRKFGVDIKTLKTFNRLRGSTIRVGQVLLIPFNKKSRQRSKKIYKVRPGDTIIKIARRFGVDPKALKRWNGKKDNFLRVGEKLVVMDN